MQVHLGSAYDDRTAASIEEICSGMKWYDYINPGVIAMCTLRTAPRVVAEVAVKPVGEALGESLKSWAIPLVIVGATVLVVMSVRK